jgi:hypothetical protein
MQHPTQVPTPTADAISVLSVRKPAAWVLRGNPRAVERARRNRLPIHARRD